MCKYITNIINCKIFCEIFLKNVKIRRDVTLWCLYTYIPQMVFFPVTCVLISHNLLYGCTPCWASLRIRSSSAVQIFSTSCLIFSRLFCRYSRILVSRIYIIRSSILSFSRILGKTFFISFDGFFTLLISVVMDLYLV